MCLCYRLERQQVYLNDPRGFLASPPDLWVCARQCFCEYFCIAIVYIAVWFGVDEDSSDDELASDTIPTAAPASKKRADDFHDEPFLRVII